MNYQRQIDCEKLYQQGKVTKIRALYNLFNDKGGQYRSVKINTTEINSKIGLVVYWPGRSNWTYLTPVAAVLVRTGNRKKTCDEKLRGLLCEYKGVRAGICMGQCAVQAWEYAGDTASTFFPFLPQSNVNLCKIKSKLNKCKIKCVLIIDLCTFCYLNAVACADDLTERSLLPGSRWLCARCSRRCPR